MLIITRQRQRTEVRREQIIEAAQKIILESGGEKVTIKAIAAEVGITEGAIYRHFESKNEIFSSLLDEISGNMLGELEKSLITDGRVMEYLRQTLFNHVSTIKNRHAISFQIIAEVNSLGDRMLNKKLKDILAAYIGCVRNLLALGVRTGEIREDIDLDSAALLFYGMIESVSNFWIVSGYTFDLEEKTQRMWDIFQAAVAKSRK